MYMCWYRHETLEPIDESSRPLNYDWLVRRIKKYMPDLYESLGLDFYNPYEEKTRVTRTHYVLVHSSIEYFIHK